MESSTMQDILTAIFGIYTPVTSDAVVSAADGSVAVVNQVASGMAGVDWPYVLGVLLFAVVLYSFFRLIGAILKGA